MVTGYFNSPLYPLEKSGVIEDYSKSINDLVDFISATGLMDINLTGFKFTWSNKRLGKNLIQVRIDKFLLLSNWKNYDSFPRSIFYHNAILLSLEESKEKKILSLQV